jgi:hypothetical protein
MSYVGSPATLPSSATISMTKKFSATTSQLNSFLFHCGQPRPVILWIIGVHVMCWVAVDVWWKVVGGHGYYSQRANLAQWMDVRVFEKKGRWSHFPAPHRTRVPHNGQWIFFPNWNIAKSVSDGAHPWWIPSTSPPPHKTPSHHQHHLVQSVLHHPRLHAHMLAPESSPNGRSQQQAIFIFMPKRG